MANVNILNGDVAIGNTAVANFGTFLDGSADDMASLQVIWKDHNGTTLSDETWSGSDVSATGPNGEAVTITDPTGTGNYQATLKIDPTTWVGVTSQVTGTIQATATNEAADGGGSKTSTFQFTVVPTNITIELTSTTITNLVKRGSGLLERVPHVAKSTTDTRVDFGKGVIYSIPDATKNGGAIANGTDFSWSLYQTNATILDTPAVNDHYVFTVQRHLDNTTIEDYTTEATRYVVAKLQPYYADTDLTTYPTVQYLIADRAIGRIKEDLSEGVALESAHYRSGFDLKKEVDAVIMDIQSGKASITDNTLALVSRRANSMIGGFKHADGAVSTRLDLVDRAQQTTGIYITLYPEDIQTSPRSL